jgi:hypothetical protein
MSQRRTRKGNLEAEQPVSDVITALLLLGILDLLRQKLHIFPCAHQLKSLIHKANYRGCQSLMQMKTRGIVIFVFILWMVPHTTFTTPSTNKLVYTKSWPIVVVEYSKDPVFITSSGSRI